MGAVQDLENARIVPFSAPSSSGISGTVLLAVIVSVVVVFALACVLAWRHTRHRLSFDAWGLPVRALVRPCPLPHSSAMHGGILTWVPGVTDGALEVSGA